MSKLIRQISVFVSSPGGLTEERELVETVCKQLSKDFGKHLGFVLEVLRWESHTRPAAGISAQDTINKQMGLDYDIYLGMLGARFGTPTERWGSGTEEEFELAFENWSKNSYPEIMFYFAESGPSLDQIDPEDLMKRQQFRRKLEVRGVLHSSFKTKSDFEHSLRKHLIDAIHQILHDHSADLPKRQKEESNLDPLSNWKNLLDEDPAVQVEDLFLSGKDNLVRATELLKSYSDRTQRLGRTLEKDARSLQAATARADDQKISKIISTALSNVSGYSRFLKNLIVELNDELSDGLGNFSRGFFIVKEKLPAEASSFADLASALDLARSGAESALISINGMTLSLNSWPNEIPAAKQQRNILQSLTKDLSSLMERTIRTMTVIIEDVRAVLT